MNKYILGIHCGHDATASLINDNGEVVFAIAEERLSRVKYHSGFPYLAINEVLKQAKIKKSEIKHLSSSSKRVFFPTSTWYNEYLMSDDITYKSKFDISNLPKTSSTYKKIIEQFKQKFTQQKEFSTEEIELFSRNIIDSKLKELGFNNYKFEVTEHHHTHATSAFYQSGVNDALIVTLDGSGDGLCGSISIGENATIKRVAEISADCSLGRVYSEITRFLGFKRNRHEGKITGLAAYGEAERLIGHFSKFIRFNKESLSFDWDAPNESQLKRKIKTVKRILMNENFGNPQQDYMHEYLVKNFDPKKDGNDLSASVQKLTEDITVELIKAFLEKYPNKNIVLAGGIFANVRVNQCVGNIQGIEYVYIHQNMGDGGCALGAALDSWSKSNSKKTPALPKNVYYGPEYSNDEVLKELKGATGIEWTKSDNIERDVAELIHKNTIVGRFSGKMEYGPRSLGNRSILAKTTDKTINDWLNERLNRTEFMPFAPAIYDKYAGDVFNNYNTSSTKYASEFMTVTYDVKEKWVEQLQAAVHVDGTARPQIVTSNNNKKFHEILQHFYKLSGIPGVINTSFNSHEEPIVMTPKHAIKSLIQGTVDVLAIEDFLVKKK